MKFTLFDVGYVMRSYYFPNESPSERAEKALKGYQKVYNISENNLEESMEEAHENDHFFFCNNILMEARMNTTKAPSEAELMDFYDYYERLNLKDILKKFKGVV